MALVRKTDKLYDAIVMEITKARAIKIKNWHNQSIMQLITDLFYSSYDQGLLISPRHKSWVDTLTISDVQDIVGLKQVQIRCILRTPIQSSGFGILNTMDQILPKICPAPRKPSFTLTTSDRHIVCAFHNMYAATSDIIEPMFSVVLTVPAVIKKTNNTTTCISHHVLDWPHYYSPSGPTEGVCPSGLINNCKFEQIDESSEFLPPPIRGQFLALQQCQDDLVKSLTRFDKTLIYIGEELWQLPSLNKMIEFFPPLKIYLPQETLNQLNKGAPRKKKEYNVSLPDQDILIGATEASIK